MAISPPNYSPVLPALIAQGGLEVPDLVILDVGCSGGIEPMWNAFLPRIRAYGFDPIATEIERLSREDGREGFVYVAGSVTGPEPPPRSHAYQGWFERVSSIAAYQAMQRNYRAEVFNAGAPITVMSEAKFTLDDWTRDNAIGRVDFVKVDTDGHDYQCLAGATEVLKGALGVHVEATFNQEAGSVFREIDALMAAAGFYLADFHTARYTRAALPGRFATPWMADNEAGGAMWGDFLYLRDTVRYGPKDMVGVLRLAMLAELFNLGDIAAEALLDIRAEAPEAIEGLLDGLVRYSALPDAGSYAALMARFEAEPRSFAPPQPGAEPAPPEPEPEPVAPPDAVADPPAPRSGWKARLKRLLG